MSPSGRLLTPATEQAALLTPVGEPRLLVGRPIAEQLRAGIRERLVRFRATNGFVPALAVVLVGRQAPSAVYLEQILRACRSVGIDGRRVEAPADASVEDLCHEIERLNADPAVAGIVVQMPLPPGLPVKAVAEAIDPAKDIDGIHPLNIGLLAMGQEGFAPATALACIEILKRSGIELEGRRAVVVGRSNIVGKPAALLLLRENATVTICHSRTPDLAAHLREADIVVAAIGRAGFIRGEHLRPGAVVVDVGINVRGSRIVGDVDFESARGVVGAITPVPGGVGPLTSALLLVQLVRAAESLAARRLMDPSEADRTQVQEAANSPGSPALAQTGTTRVAR